MPLPDLPVNADFEHQGQWDGTPTGEITQTHRGRKPAEKAGEEPNFPIRYKEVDE